MKALFYITLTAIAFLIAALSLRGAEKVTADADIPSLLRERVDKAKQTPGIVVGVLDETGSKIFNYGTLGPAGSAAVDGDTVFEIGSASKAFTSLLLADMVERGEVKLDDPISQYLPSSVKVPSRNGRQMTLVDLATHTSGLPRLPGNMPMKDQENPYADYTVEQMYAFLSGYKLTRDIGAEYEYSNLGAGLLGHILALKAGMSYEALLQRRICQPLGMTNTQITLSPDLQKRLAIGHNAGGEPVKNWDLPALAGAGAIRSTANDLLKFLAANMGLTKSELFPAMQLMQQPRHSAGSATMDIGLGWHIAKKFDTQLIWHNGGTGGYRSFMGFDLQKKYGVVVLVNSANSIDDLGFHLLQSKYPLTKFEAKKERAAIQLKPEALDSFVGSYEMAPNVFLDVRRDGDQLKARLTGQSYFAIYPEAETEFFYKVVDAQLSFTKDDTGKVTELTLHQNGRDLPAKRISDKPGQ